MATASLALTYADLYSILGYELGYQRDNIASPAIWSAGQIADLSETIKRGLRRFYFEALRPDGSLHRWSFLRPTTAITLWSSISIGSATVTGGAYSGGLTTLTASTASFYETMIGHSIVVTGVGTFTVYSYTSATVIAVSGNASAAAGATFAIAADGNYTLPADFGMPAGPLIYPAGSSQRRIEVVSEAEILAARSAADATGTPSRAAFRSRAHDSLLVQRRELLVHPVPVQNVTPSLRYHVMAATPDSANSYATWPYGAAEHAEALLECVLAAGEIGILKAPGVHTAEAQRLLAAAVQADAGQAPDYLLDEAGGESPAGSWLDGQPVSFNGTDY